MSPMGVALVTIVFATGLVVAHVADGRVRLAGVLTALTATAAALAAVDGLPAALWLLGPAVGCLSAPRPRKRLSFEAVIRRTGTLAGLAVAATWVAAQLAPVDTPWPLLAVTTNLAALGLAWALAPRDREDEEQGAVLAIAGGAALLLVAGRHDPISAVLSGGLAALPRLAPRWNHLRSHRLRWIIPWLFAGLAALSLAVAAAGGPLRAAFGVDALTASALAVIFLAAALLPPGEESVAALLLGLGLATPVPALRWAGLAAAAALMLNRGPRPQRFAWLGLALLAVSAAAAALLPTAQTSRVIPVALAAGWLLLAHAALGGRARSLLLPGATFYLATAVINLASAAVPRFQVMAAAGAILLAASSVKMARTDGVEPRAALTTALLLVALASARPEGMLAAFLLVVDLAIVQAAPPASAASSRWLDRLRVLSYSGWPGAAAFAGRSLAVVASVQVGVPLAALATALVACLLVAPVLPGAVKRAPIQDPRFAWVSTGVSLVVGIAPAILSRLQGG